MIITKTPFRISFFGGMSDYPEWFTEHGGQVLGTTIDKYCYIMVRDLPPNFKNKYRIVYNKEEFVDDVDDIQHTVVRGALQLTGRRDVEVVHWSDLPARKGLGSSSSFAVGMMNALKPNRHERDMAGDAAKIEREILKENVGYQDQHLAAFGGFRKFIISSDWVLTTDTIDYGDLEDWLMLFDTGTERIASDIAKDVVSNIPDRVEYMKEIVKTVDMGMELLRRRDYEGFGRLLGYAWHLKQKVSDKICPMTIHDIYHRATTNGALGGKLLGAGGGGYMLFVVEPSKQEQVKQALGLKHIPFKFEDKGSQVIYGLSLSQS